MTDAVREYRDACRAPACSIDREAFNWNRATALLRGRDYLAKYADAAITELEDKVEELDDKLMEAEGVHDVARRWFEEQKKQFARAEQAEAKARRWEWVATHQLLATGPHGQEELQSRVPSVVTDLLARYEEAHG